MALTVDLIADNSRVSLTQTFTPKQNTIRGISLLLSRFGSRTDYTCTVSIYKSLYGIPIGEPLATANRLAKDITFAAFYNFIFDQPIDFSDVDELVIVFQQSIDDNNNFIFWHFIDNQEYYKALNTTTNYQDSYFYGYGYLYGYGQYSQYTSDFFDVFGLDSINLGYLNSQYYGNGGYGFEYTGWRSEENITRCFKVYNEINQIAYDFDSAYVKIPSGNLLTQKADNAQDLYDGYKRYVDIVGNKVMLRDVGKRVAFINISDQNSYWMPTNRNLPPMVNDISYCSNKNTSSPYKTIASAATNDGIYVSFNSGGDWDVISGTENINFYLCNISVYNDGTYIIIATSEEDLNYYMCVCALHENESNFSVINKTQIIDKPMCLSVNWAFQNNHILVGTNNGLYSNSDNNNPYTITPNNVINSVACNNIYRQTDNIGIICNDTGLYTYNISTGAYSIISPSQGYAPINDTIIFKNRIYIATNNGILLNKNVSTIYSSSNIEFVGKDPFTNPYILGIPDCKAYSMSKSIDDDGNDMRLFVSTENGIFMSESGFDFTSIYNELYPDVDVKKSIINPSDNRLIHILTNTVKKRVPFVTLIIDESGSMYRRQNFADDQYKLSANLIKNIHDNNSEAKFQVILFSTKEMESINTDTNDRSRIDRTGATNLYGGFVPYSEEIYQDIINSSPNIHYKTPLYETLWATFSGLYSGGSGWEYNGSLSKYTFDNSENELLNNSDKIIILVTDGNDTNSIKTINDVVDGFTTNIGTKQSAIKLYTIAYGEQSNLDVLKSITTYNTEVLYSKNNDVDNYNTILNYLSDKEAYRRRDGNYRKNFKFDSDVFVKKISVFINTSNNTSIKYRWRTSKNIYDLGYFNDYKQFDINGLNIIDINIACRYIEVDFLLESKNINDSPSINNINIEYFAPSESVILFNPIKNNFSTRIHELILSTNTKTYQKYGYAYGNDYGYSCDTSDFFHIFNQSNDVPHLDVKALFNQSNSHHSELFEQFKFDHKNFTKNRTLEKTTSYDYISYQCIGGPWDYDQKITVYSNGVLISDNIYYLLPQYGKIIFNEPRRASDVIQVTIENSNLFNIGMKITNFENNDYIKIENISYQFMPEDTTVNNRVALPLFSSQISEESSGIVSYGSNVENNLDNIIYGYSVNMQITILVKKTIDNNSNVIFGFGDFTEIPNTGDIIMRQHELFGILSSLQTTNSAQNNFTKITTTKAGINFSNIKQSATYGGFLEANLNGTLNKGDRIIISIVNLDTILHRNVETRHIKDDYSSAVDVFGALNTNFAISLENNIFKQTTPNLIFSSTIAADRVHIACPTTPSSNTFDATVTIIDTNGVIATKTTAEVQLSIIELDSGLMQNIGQKTIIFSTEDMGSKKVSISIPSGYSKCHIGARYMSSGNNAALVGGYYTTSNIILLNSPKKILWGDLNVKSSFGNGRHSPQKIYDYAKNASGLDFCVIADNANEIDETLWGYQKDIADYYNVSGEFVTMHGLEWVPPDGVYNVGYKVAIFGQQGSPNIAKVQNMSLDSFLTNMINYSPILFSEHPAYANNEIFRKFNVNYNSLSKKQSEIQLENAVEIYSEHGNSESPEAIDNKIINGATAADSSFATDAIASGFLTTFIASSDSQTGKPGLYATEIETSGRGLMPSSDETNSSVNNRGITAVITNDFSRSGIFDAIKARHTYCTTGARIHLDFKLGSHMMGDVVNVQEINAGSTRTSNIPLDFIITIKPTSDRGTISIIRVNIGNNSTTTYNTVFSSNFTSGVTSQQYTASDIIDGHNKDLAYFVKVVQSDRHIAWSSPIYIKYKAT